MKREPGSIHGGTLSKAPHRVAGSQPARIHGLSVQSPGRWATWDWATWDWATWRWASWGWAVLAVSLLAAACGGSSNSPTGPGAPERNTVRLASVSPAFGSTLAAGSQAEFRLRYNCDLETCFLNVFFLDGNGRQVSGSSFGNPAVGRGEGTHVFNSGVTVAGVTEEVLLTLDDSLFFIPFIDPPLFEARVPGRFVWE